MSWTFSDTNFKRSFMKICHMVQKLWNKNSHTQGTTNHTSAYL